ncbi:hypothetical protein CGI33_21035 [Vibrio parahaemolyticus]|nr:hypothetical protein CGK33_23730 [Vibrio parahaemolyticus]TOC21841.1 hypothetical protein CGJ89_22445 [Vibrio parahaemolyticus]TOJ73753.1 hypothetical protein CGI33_21035 [Vibrio parahaemolyticus]
MPHWFLQSVGCEFHWLKVWKGQVKRGFRSRVKLVSFRFASSKATLSLKVCISRLSKLRLKYSGFYRS